MVSGKISAENIFLFLFRYYQTQAIPLCYRAEEVNETAGLCHQCR